MDQQDKSAHTPGPWHVRLSDNATPHIEHGNCMLDEVGELRNRICVMPAEVTQPFNSLANARLIAAAPDLYEAAEAAMQCIGELPPTQARVEVVQMLQAALSKATGSQQ